MKFLAGCSLLLLAGSAHAAGGLRMMRLLSGHTGQQDRQEKSPSAPDPTIQLAASTYNPKCLTSSVAIHLSASLDNSEVYVNDWYLGYPDCAGTMQSPVNLAIPAVTLISVTPFSLAFSSGTCAGNEMSFTVDEAVWKVGFDGCTTQPSLTFEGQVYNLLQFHIHSPSEFEIGGAEYSAGIHFVHLKEGTTSDLLVVGVAFDTTTHSTNVELQKYWNVLATGASTTTQTFTASPYNLLPLVPGFTHFLGSLTTPPCTEGVKWIFMSNPSYMSEAQLEAYRNSVAVFPGSKVSELGNTNRPIQPVNGRDMKYVVL